MPNTAALEFSNNYTNLMVGSKTYSGVETGQQSDFEKNLSYVEGLTVTRLQTPRANGKSRWKFQFTPAGKISYKRFFFPDFVELANVEFTSWQIGAGFGPEFGLHSGKHYTYFKYTPILSWYQLNWQQPDGDAEVHSAFAITTQAEIGYLYFINNQASVKLFSKSTQTPGGLWDDVVRKINPRAPKITTSNDAVAGISFGYTFNSH